MALLRTYDCPPHDLIVVKLEAYDLDKTGLNLLLDYLTLRNQQIQVNSSYKGVLRGFILGLLLYNEFITDPLRFTEKPGTCNFADDNTLWPRSFRYQDKLET